MDTQRLVAIHVWGQTTGIARSGWTASASAGVGAAHVQGFSTGQFMGNALYMHTTHLKQGWARHGNGAPEATGQPSTVHHPQR
jgi:hypothetical protein